MKKADLNTIIGFTLIGLILIYFSYTSQQELSKLPSTDSKVVDTVSAKVPEMVKNTPVMVADSLLSDSIVLSAAAQKFGVFGTKLQANAKSEVFVLENSDLLIEVDALGAQIVKVELKDYKSYDSLPLQLVNGKNQVWSLIMEGKQEYLSSGLMFEGQLNGRELKLSAPTTSGEVLSISYNLAKEGFLLDMDVQFRGIEIKPKAIQWQQDAIRHELNRELEDQQTTLSYMLAEKQKVKSLSAGKSDEKEKPQVVWVASKQQFFSSVLRNSEPFSQSKLASYALEDEAHTKRFAFKGDLNPDDKNLKLQWFFVPNHYKTLKDYGHELDELIPMGWGIFGWINRGVVVNLFHWLESYHLNYGIIILIMAILIKLVLFPLTYRSYLSMAKTRVLKPEMDELNEQFKDKDPMKKQQALLDLYKKAGVNPLGGCVPVLLQFPILIAIFRFFPASIELRHQPFLWANDLSTYDSIYTLPFNIPFYGEHVSLFTLLMTVSTLLYTYFNNQLTQQNNQYPQLKYMMYLMPIVFLGVFNNYSAGLSYYYFVANMLTFGQQFAIRSFVDDNAIHAKIQENKKKPKKESGFQKKIEEMAKQQQLGSNRRMRRS